MQLSRRVTLSTLLGVALGAAAGCGGVPPIVDCSPRGNLRPICGLQNPEDLALLPDGQTLLVSQFGAMDGTRSGNLALLDLPNDRTRIAFGGSAGVDAVSRETHWGDPGCPGPPSSAFSPHGIDLLQRPDGTWLLLAVNHGGREAVEFFEIRPDALQSQVVWRGCAIPPEDAFLNDVVGLADGRFLTTHMFPRGSGIGQMLKGGLFGMATGHVYRWAPGAGFDVLPGSEFAFPNGIEISRDEASAFVNLYLTSEVVKLDITSGEVLGRAPVSSPDNSTWSPDGRLLIASHNASLADVRVCADLREGACGFEFSIVALDPDTLEAEILFTNSGPPMGAGTAALRVGDELVIGSFAGDRVLRARIAGNGD